MQYPKHRTVVIVSRFLFAALTTLAIIVQFAVAAQKPNFNPVNFFSFFTIESNIIAAIVLAVGGWAMLTGVRAAWWDTLRGGATTFMVITGIIYILLLSGMEEALQTTLPWANLVLHYILPVVMLLDWSMNPPNKRLSLKQVGVWLLFPVVYAIYSLLRGPLVNWYPYPFLDPRPEGYVPVFVSMLGIGVATVIICLVIKATGNYQVRNLKKT